MKHVVIIGGGAAGFFSALACAEHNSHYQVTILEKSPNLLSKVKISGGGRCNVTHACYDPKLLVKNYPRGEKELIGPFMRFNPTNTVEWFSLRDVKLKTETDGRMFPITDLSQTIIDCFLNEAKRLHVTIKTQTGVSTMQNTNGKWQLQTNKGDTIIADAVIITAGSSASVWDMLRGLGHNIIRPVPSLFTFNIKDERIKDLQGLAVPNATVTVQGTKLQTKGPLLITHWGLSGPAILRLSAWGARQLADISYKCEIEVNWTGAETVGSVTEYIKQYKGNHPKQTVAANPQLNIPSRLWEKLCGDDIKALRFADLSNKHITLLANNIAACKFAVTGKSTFKDEFVTAGGIDLKEVDFKTMQSKKLPGIYFAGEVLDIDAITGGFNFQSAWTTGYIAGTSI